MTKAKISRNRFLALAAKDSGIDVEVLSKSFEAIENRLYKDLASGKRVILTGFGAFYLQKHKGHPVQFEVQYNSKMPDYVLMKFSTADVMNRRFRKDYEDGKVIIPKE